MRRRSPAPPSESEPQQSWFLAEWPLSVIRLGGILLSTSLSMMVVDDVGLT